MNKKIAIQGIGGSYHHMAAEKFFGPKLELLECEFFKEIPESILSNHVDYGLMAIENTIAGSILQNYRLLQRDSLKIIGEVYIPIDHQLLVLNGQNISEITEVHSHPMALLQCEQFFEDHPHIKLIESVDTSQAAKEVKDGNIKNRGAIASKLAGKIFDLKVLAKDIHTFKNNYTRFFVIGRDEDHSIQPDNINKASLKIVLKHEQGSLAKVLSVFLMHGINLTKIQSVPIMNRPWEYEFYIDVEIPSIETFNAVLEVIGHQVNSINVLGMYKAWNLK
jgi:prephenate dehydratase